MGESLLSSSEVLLFGREVDDVQIRNLDRTAADFTATVATAKKLEETKGHPKVNGVKVKKDDQVLVQRQHGPAGLYKVKTAAEDWDKINVTKGKTIIVEDGVKFKGSFWINVGTTGDPKFKKADKRKKIGVNNQLYDQLSDDSRLARIYGFSFEGTYYDLPGPTLFLVHGDGESATDDNLPGDLAARAPNDPSRSGVSAADFQIADDIRVWAYDKADYSIRMDVSTGQFEQILLDIFFEVEAPMIAGGRVAGGRVAGGRVAGGRVAGGRVAGGRVAGGRVSGGRVGGSSD